MLRKGENKELMDVVPVGGWVDGWACSGMELNGAFWLLNDGMVVVRPPQTFDVKGQMIARKGQAAG